ncbi:hypothetical protein PR202_ga12542 [Eleusine coracana subsp. coracana]|uniref:Uncharacterized protein n=1 Tax=Eleusine coracana subsp. coracana TaxID=191504 RepID=A0AAV5CCD3_ELECO|nr:hypothetical protein PR202_ga12542 [Eleusine coracana subsp. coracana]
MASKNDTQTWADQRGSRKYGSFKTGSSDSRAGKNMVSGNVKATASEGLIKAKTAALAGAEKVKSGTSRGINWVKEQY